MYPFPTNILELEQQTLRREIVMLKQILFHANSGECQLDVAYTYLNHYIGGFHPVKKTSPVHGSLYTHVPGASK